MPTSMEHPPASAGTATPTPAATAAAVEMTDVAITFPQGLVGCETWKRFVLVVDGAEELPVATLQSLDDAHVAFLVSDPTLILEDYRAALTPEDRALLGLGADAQPALFCTLTVGADGWLTANLLGPLAINPSTRRGKQLVLADSPYSTRHPVARLGAEEQVRAEVGVGAATCSS